MVAFLGLTCLVGLRGFLEVFGCGVFVRSLVIVVCRFAVCRFACGWFRFGADCLLSCCLWCCRVILVVGVVYCLLGEYCDLDVINSVVLLHYCAVLFELGFA